MYFDYFAILSIWKLIAGVDGHLPGLREPRLNELQKGGEVVELLSSKHLNWIASVGISTRKPLTCCWCLDKDNERTWSKSFLTFLLAAKVNYICRKSADDFGCNIFHVTRDMSFHTKTCWSKWQRNEQLQELTLFRLDKLLLDDAVITHLHCQKNTASIITLNLSHARHRNNYLVFEFSEH